MAKKNTVSKNIPDKVLEGLSSAELYELARKAEQAERQRKAEENKERIKALRRKKRELKRQYEQEIKKIDAEIERLGGKTKISSTNRKSRSDINLTDIVVGIIQDAGTITSKDLKARLKAKGYATNNLPQLIAYLKRQGRISSPERAVYAIAA